MGRARRGLAGANCRPGVAGVRRVSLAALALLVLILAPRPGSAADPASDDPAERGQYVFAASGCAACHTAQGEGAAFLAGGRALATPYGTFYTPNITPDPDHGIGRWSEDDFRRALRQGRGPDGTVYFPAFPYTAYTGMTDRDIGDLWAYLRTVPASAQADRPHELDPPFGWRWLLPLWRLLYFDEGPPQVPLGRPAAWYRGAYLVEVMGHCGQCHTPRTWLGGLNTDRPYAGTTAGPGGRRVPNITPDPAAGIGGWSDGDLAYFLESGMTSEGDFVGGEMAEVIRNGTSQLSAEDRRAIVVYLRSLRPIGPPPSH